jgi:hypothetical protein
MLRTILTIRRFCWHFLLFWAICSGITFISPGCASQGRPDGGMKDTVPPQIIRSIPENLTTQFIANTIVIEFDEYIELKEAKKQVYISPPLDKDLILNLKGKNLEIKLESPLADSTTYTISFGTAIQDFRERNVQKKFKYIFSTGSFIDSLKVTGSVRDGISNKPQKETAIMLFSAEDFYRSSDSLPYNEKPLYYTISDEKGHFEIDFMRPGKYLCFALNDKDGDFKYKRSKESMAFHPTLIDTDSIPTIDLRLSTEPADPLLRQTGHDKYNQIRFILRGKAKKFDYQFLEPLDSSIVYHLITPKIPTDTFTLFINDFQKDSLRILVGINDTIADTTLVFRRKYEVPKPIVQLIPNQVRPDDTVRMTANYPFRINKNTFARIIQGKDTTWEALPVSMDYQLERPLPFLSVQSKNAGVEVMIEPNKLDFLGGLEHDTLMLNYKIPTTESFSHLNIILDPQWEASFVFELSKESGSSILSIPFKDKLIIDLPYLAAGSYQMKLLEDSDENKKWSPGLWHIRKQPERYFYYEEKITLKSNWEVELSWKPKLSDFIPAEEKDKEELIPSLEADPDN